MNALNKQTQENKNASMLQDRSKRKWQWNVQSTTVSDFSLDIEDISSHPATFNPSEQLYVVTGEPGSGKTTHLKLYVKGMIKLQSAAAYIVDANPTFKFTPGYSNAYHNLIEEYYGKVFTTDSLDYQALLEVKTVTGIDVSPLSTSGNISSCAEFILQLAKLLQQEATAQDRFIVLVLENIQRLGLLEGSQPLLHQLVKLINEHFYIAASTRYHSDILRAGLLKDAFIVDNLERRQVTQHQGASQ